VGRRGSVVSQLMVAPGLAERVAAIVALESSVAAPGFDHGGDCGDGEGTAAARPEEWGVIVGVGMIQHPISDGAGCRGVEGDRAMLLGLRLLEGQEIARLEAGDLSAGEGQKLIGPVGGVDPEGEEAKIARPARQRALDRLDRGQVADGINLDGRAPFGMVGVVHGGAGSSDRSEAQRYADDMPEAQLLDTS